MTIHKIPDLNVFQWQQSVKDKSLSSPPVSPNKGDRYIIAETGSGTWTSYTGNIATYRGSIWEFMAPIEGILVWVEDENKFYKYTGSQWKNLISSGGIIL